jgi:hypothetical protein
MNNDSEKKIVGYWYIPNNTDKQISGTLHITSDGAILELLDSFKSITEFLSTENIPIILGVTAEEKQITLQNCIDIGGSIGNINKQKFKISGPIYLGFLASDGKIPLFDQLDLDFENFQNWFNQSGFSYQHMIIKETTASKYNLSYSSPKKIEMKINDINLVINTNYCCNTDNHFKFSLHQSCSLKIIPSEMISADVFFKYYIRPLQAFFTFVFGTACNIKKTTFYNSNYTITFGEHKSIYPIETVLPLINYKSQEVFFDKMLFTYNDINNNLEEILQKWFDMYNKMKLIFELFVNVDNYFYLEHRFSNTINSLEGFHRIFFNNEIQPIDLFKEKIDHILSYIPENDKMFVSDALKYKNEPNLRKRLQDLFLENDPVLTPLINNRKNFINKVVTIRNDMVHMKNQHNTKSSDSQLYYHTLMLLLILKINILRKLVDCKLADSFIKKDILYKKILWNKAEIQNNHAQA